MFRDAGVLDRQRTAASFDQALGRYTKEAESWFDGGPDSVDRRLAAATRLLHAARSVVARISIADSQHYLGAIESLESDRQTLEAMRHAMLTEAADWEARSPRTGSRDAGLVGPDRRWVELEAAKFLAANTDTLDDSRELSVRAANYAQAKTSTFPRARSAAITEAFVAKVGSLHATAPKPRTAKTAAVFEDFDPQAMFL